MALTGTLKDFGIAEILQLIGQQAKSGTLHVENRDEKIHVIMADGCVVEAAHEGRKKKQRLGALLVRAGLLAEEDLEKALEMQSRTLRRLGDVLIEMRLLGVEDLKEVMALQTTETIYGLFTWKSGTYEFEPGEVEWDSSTVTPLRAESVLMEGFRRLDEWPIVRRKITSLAATLARTDKALSEGELGPGERKILDLAVPGRTVEAIVDLSRLGEFETCKLLVTLVNTGLLEVVPPPRRSAAASVGEYAKSWRDRLKRGLAGAVATFALAAVLAGLAFLASERAFPAEAGGASPLQDRALERFLSRYQLSRLDAALAVFRLEHGQYPERLSLLVEAGLVDAKDLRYPFSEEYYYRRKSEGSFVLLPPLP